jgi:Ca2+-binding EF-hand superfamily protein
MLLERGSMSVRGVAQVFRILDKNKNRKIDAGELEGGLRQMGINLVEEQVSVLIKHFDNDKSG